MIEEFVLNNFVEAGMAVAFIGYLIFDKTKMQYAMRKSLDNNTIALNKVSAQIEMLRHSSNAHHEESMRGRK